MGLAEQWERITRSLPEGWEQADFRLRVTDRRLQSRAAALLGPLAPGRGGDELHFTVSRTTGVGPDAAGRLLAKLDDERIGATLALGRRLTRGAPQAPAHDPLEEQWDKLAATLPEDWSDLLCGLTVDSSDDLPRVTLLAAPLNPSRPEKQIGFEFRVARSSGYGASPQMTRRCLARLDEAGVGGDVEVLRALSDTQHVSTQGPVWYVGGKVL
jgi:hypothetical protein